MPRFSHLVAGVSFYLLEFFPVELIHTPQLFLRGLLSRPGLLAHTQGVEDHHLHRLQELHSLAAHIGCTLLVHLRSTLPRADQEQQHTGDKLVGCG